MATHVFGHAPDPVDTEPYWSWWCECGATGRRFGPRELAEESADNHRQNNCEEEAQ